MEKVNLSQAEPLVLTSTNSTLLANGIFTSAVFPIRGYRHLRGFAFSDQSSANNGFVIQQAADTADFASGFFTQASVSITGNNTTTNTLTATIVAPFARIVYTNGAVAQNTFRLFVMAGIGS